MRDLTTRLQKAFLLVAFFVTSVVPLSASAEDALSEQRSNQVIDVFPGRPDSAVNCFDYYHFGSVQVDVEGLSQHATSGTAMEFFGVVRNDNNYPVVDGAVYAKVFRKPSSDQSVVQANGYDVVDQFFVEEHLNLAANGSKSISFEWQVPVYAISGEYQIAFFFTSAHKFNLSGLSFTDDITGNIFDFSVSGEGKQVTAFNKNTVKVDGAPYHFAAFTPKLDKAKPILTTVDLANPLDESQVIHVTWKLYGWDAQSDDNLITTKEEDITLNPKETKQLLFTNTDTTQPVYLLVAEAKYMDAKSILNIRYSREDVDRVRINFPALTNYPLEAGKEVTMFSCVHGAGTNDVVGNNKLTLDLKDDQGNVVHTYQYEGDVTSAMMAVKDNFTPKDTMKNFSLEAALYHNGQKVDGATMVYDCEALGGIDCPKKAGEGVADMLSDSVSSVNVSISKIVLALVAALLLLLVVAMIRHRQDRNALNNQSNENKDMPKKVKILVFALMMVSGFGWVDEASAKSTQWNYVNDQDAFLFYGTSYSGAAPCPHASTGWLGGLSNPNVTVMRNANSSVADGSTVTVGTVLSFTAPVTNQDISWFGTGGAGDSPYGYWRTDATRPTLGTDDYIGNFTYHKPRLCSDSDPGATTAVYIALSVNPSAITFTHDGSTAQLNCNPNGSVCTVQSAGTVKVQVKYASTYGKFYYQSGVSSGTDPMKHCDIDSCQATIADFTLDVPQQQINFSFEAIKPSNPPSVPVIAEVSGNSHYVGEYQRFTVVSTDSDSLQVRYCIDWDADVDADSGVVGGGDGIPGNDCMQKTVLVDQGVPKVVRRAWSTPGKKHITAQAIDDGGMKSNNWSNPFEIRINKSPFKICPPEISVDKDKTSQLDSWFGTGTCVDHTGDTNVTGASNWSSDNSLIASVDNVNKKGLVTGKSVGNTNIRASYVSGPTTYSAYVPVTVSLPVPTVSLSASKTLFSSAGGDSILSWNATNNPTDCDASSSPVLPGWSGQIAPPLNPNADSKSVTFPPNSTTSPRKYTLSLTCSNANGSGTGSVVVTVNPPCQLQNECADRGWNAGDDGKFCEDDSCVFNSCTGESRNGTKACRVDNWKEVAP